MKFKTEQEEFWAGNFGKEYIKRNQGDIFLASSLNFFTKALRNASGIKSCIEFGANVGNNLKALKLLRPELDLHAIEINKDAAQELCNWMGSTNVHNLSILDFAPLHQCDLVLIKGVLIHIDPNMLSKVYEKLVESTGRYLLVAEYYNPVPVGIPYRGHENRLFKRDFAGEIMDTYPRMKLIDYGFAYHRDLNFPQDDITWFLLKKD